MPEDYRTIPTEVYQEQIGKLQAEIDVLKKKNKQKWLGFIKIYPVLAVWLIGIYGFERIGRPLFFSTWIIMGVFYFLYQYIEGKK